MDMTQLVFLSQQMADYQSMDAIANNLANVSTPGFKRETPQFQAYLEQMAPAEGQTGQQSVNFVAQMGSFRDLSEGPFELTGAPFDVALNGQGYFTIQTANGPLYTRNGHFTLDASGRIVNDNGDPVQGTGGDISISANDGDIHIAADGTVSGQNGQIGQLNIVDFRDDRALVKEGDSLYSTTQQSQSPTNTAVQQGAIETANVRPVIEISQMIEVMRSYQATLNLAQSQSDLQRQTIDKLATTQS
jgi:flagellar basal-body rod protein FlgF